MHVNLQKLETAVDAAQAEFPGLSFGYIGNCERWGDDRRWEIFLPHPGRIGECYDRVVIGSTQDILTHSDIDAVIWSALDLVRRLWSKGAR